MVNAAAREPIGRFSRLLDGLLGEYVEVLPIEPLEGMSQGDSFNMTPISTIVILT